MEKLKQLRKERKIKQQEIADFLKISRQAYSHYENEQRQPTPETLDKLADYFNVSVDYLLGREEKTTITDPDKNKISIIARGGYKYTEVLSDEDMEAAIKYIELLKKAQGIPTKDKKDK